MRHRRADNASDDETVELAGLADGSLAGDRRQQLKARVAASSELSDRLAEQRQALALTRGAAVTVTAPEGLRRRIDAQRQPRATRPSRRLVFAGAAAAVVAAASVAVVTLSVGSSEASFRAALAPTGLAPGAHGAARFERRPSGWRVELHATGLPRLSDGAFYEAWLRNDAGVLVPVGTFNDGRDVTLWAGVAPPAFTVLTVTRELADGDQSSSGQKVLAGTVTRSG